MEVKAWWHWRTLQPMLAQATLVVGILIGVLFILAALNRAYGNNPPIFLTSLDPRYLGELCPGDELIVHNQVRIDSITIVVYSLSTMDVARVSPYLGTTTRYEGLPHPVAGVSFKQEVPWQVPDLPSGIYSRVFSGRGHDTEEKPVFVWSTYTIKSEEECL